MNLFYIVLATVAIRLVNTNYGRANEHPYIVSIYNKHTGTGKGYQLCAGSLLTNSYVLTTRFCLPRHAYKIRYGDLKTADNPTYSQILHRKYHPNSHAEITIHTKMNTKPVVSGSNNIAMALIQTVPDQKFGKLSALDYKTMVGRQVEFCAFGIPVRKIPFRSNNRTKTKKELNLKDVFKRKHKKLREYFMRMNQNQREKEASPARPIFHVRHKLTLRDENTHVIKSIVKFAAGIVTPCEGKTSIGPNICVVGKCDNLRANKRTIFTPDFGTPLIYDGKIVGIAADVDDNCLKYTPVSPFLNWVNNYVKLSSTNDTQKPPEKKRIARLRENYEEIIDETL